MREGVRINAANQTKTNKSDLSRKRTEKESLFIFNQNSAHHPDKKITNRKLIQARNKSRNIFQDQRHTEFYHDY